MMASDMSVEVDVSLAIINSFSWCGAMYFSVF